MLVSLKVAFESNAPMGKRIDVIRFVMLASEWAKNRQMLQTSILELDVQAISCANICDIETAHQLLSCICRSMCIKSLKAGQLNDFCFGNLSTME